MSKKGKKRFSVWYLVGSWALFAFCALAAVFNLGAGALLTAAFAGASAAALAMVSLTAHAVRGLPKA